MWGLILILIGLGLLIPTAYAGLIGAPYAPTWLNVVREAFAAVRLGANDTLVDLGAGDGRIVLEAARRGATAVGYELSPIMWLVAWLRTRRRQNPPKIIFGNFYKQDISGATVVFAFLMPKNMPRLKNWLARQSVPQGKYLLAYTFPLPETEPVEVVSVEGEGKIYVYDLQKLTRSATRNA